MIQVLGHWGPATDLFLYMELFTGQMEVICNPYCPVTRPGREGLVVGRGSHVELWRCVYISGFYMQYQVIKLVCDGPPVCHC